MEKKQAERELKAAERDTQVARDVAKMQHEQLVRQLFDDANP